MATMKTFTEYLEEHIVQDGNKWKVVSSDRTKELGTYDSKEEAVKRLRQIEYFKNKKS
jgi:hypothetical protein